MVTRARAPGAGPSGPSGKWTSFPWRVRPVSMAASRPAHSLDEDLFAAPDPGLVAGQRRAVDHRLETLEALGHDVGRHELRLHGGGTGTRARREDERERAVVGRLGADGERLLEVVLALAGEPDDDVGRHRQVVDGGPGRRQPLEVARRRIAAAHGAQHPVAARLEREVQLLAHLGRLGHGRDRFGPQVLRVRAGEAHASDPLDPTDGAQEVGEERSPPCQVAPVGVDVLPQQGDLAVPVRARPSTSATMSCIGRLDLADRAPRARCRTSRNCRSRSGS